jgi:hypothetical protein
MKIKKSILLSLFLLLFFVGCRNANTPNAEVPNRTASPNQNLLDTRVPEVATPGTRTPDLVTPAPVTPVPGGEAPLTDIQRTEDRLDRAIPDIDTAIPRTNLETPTIPGINMDTIPAR